MAFTGAKKRSIYEIQINQCTFFWRCNSGNVDFFHCDGGDGTLVVWGVICLIGLLSRPLSLPWWWLWGSHSNALDGMKCVFITKNKYFFLQKEVLFFAKKSTFFWQKKVLLVMWLARWRNSSKFFGGNASMCWIWWGWEAIAILYFYNFMANFLRREKRSRRWQMPLSFIPEYIFINKTYTFL